MNSTPSTISVNADSPHTRTGKYLTFTLAGDEYGIEIHKVRELVGLLDITPIPHMPTCVDGVANLRGKVLPVIDLRTFLSIQRSERTSKSCIIVVNTADRFCGVVVDKVSEVLEFSSEDIEVASSLGLPLANNFVFGMGKTKGRVTILLEIDRILTHVEGQAANL